MRRKIQFRLTLFIVFSLFAVEAFAHPNLETPLLRPLPAAEEGRVNQAFSLFSCTCVNLESLELGAGQCDCPEAKEDKAGLKAAIEGHSSEEVESGLAVIESVLDVIEEEPRMRRALRFSQPAFDELWDTTRSVCPAELLKVYRIGPISCRIRATWGLRFKTFLAVGYTVPEIFDFYVQEVNEDLPDEKKYAAHELKYEEAGNVTIFLPIAGAIVVFVVLRTFRRRRSANKEGDSGASSSKYRQLSEAEEALLREEIEDSLEH